MLCCCYLACANRNTEKGINIKFKKSFLAKKVIINLEESDIYVFVEVAFELSVILTIAQIEAMVSPR